MGGARDAGRTADHAGADESDGKGDGRTANGWLGREAKKEEVEWEREEKERKRLRSRSRSR